MNSSVLLMTSLNYEPHQKKPIKLAWELSFPVLLSYFSVGVVFGILFVQLHDPWYYAPIMSLFAYSGAVQFITIGIMASHGSYWMILLSAVFIAGRNSFYGLSLLQRFNVGWWRKAYLIFALVDANYAIFVTTPSYKDKKQDWRFCMILTLLVHSYWVTGTFVGAFFANKLVNLQGLEFVLVAYFAILLLEQYLKYKSLAPLVVGLIVAVITFVFIPSGEMLLVAILMCCLGLIVVYFGEKSRGCP